MDFDTEVKTAIYRWVAETTMVPAAAELAGVLGARPAEVRDAYRRLFGKRVLFLEPDGETIRMAPPFSGVETQHRVLVGRRSTSRTAPGTRSGSRRRSTRRPRSSRAASRRSSRSASAFPGQVPIRSRWWRTSRFR